MLSPSLIWLACFASMLSNAALSASLAAPADPASEERNIFSGPAQSKIDTPRFVHNERRQLNRRMMGEMDGTPGWQELKVIPSLKAQQRKQIHDLYEESKKEAEPLIAKLKELRNKPGIQDHFLNSEKPPMVLKMRTPLGQFVGNEASRQFAGVGPQGQFAGTGPQGKFAATGPQFVGTGQQGQFAGTVPQGQFAATGPQFVGTGQQGQFAGTGPQGQFAATGQNHSLPKRRIQRPEFLPNAYTKQNFAQADNETRFANRPEGKPRPVASVEQMEDFHRLRQELRVKRDATWEKVKALLTEQNLKDLELMRKGELLPESLKADSNLPAPASSSLSNDMQADVPGPMLMQGE